MQNSCSICAKLVITVFVQALVGYRNSSDVLVYDMTRGLTTACAQPDSANAGIEVVEEETYLLNTDQPRNTPKKQPKLLIARKQSDALTD